MSLPKPIPGAAISIFLHQCITTVAALCISPSLNFPDISPALAAPDPALQVQTQLPGPASKLQKQSKTPPALSAAPAPVHPAPWRSPKSRLQNESTSSRFSASELPHSLKPAAPPATKNSPAPVPEIKSTSR